MTQQIINLGVGPDTQTGDSLYTAFNKVNDNFSELYNVFEGNSITTINANVVLANNITVSSNVRSGNLFTYGNLETIGYVVTAGVFYPNGAPIGSFSSIENNVIPLTSNIYTIGNISNQFTQGYFSTNITLAGSNVTVRNGTIYVDGQIVSGNYGNSNVASYLPVYGGNLSATITTASQPYITQIGTISNLTANVARIYGNLVIDGNLSVDGNVSFFNVDNLLVEDPIITLNTGANGAPLTFDNGFDSGVKTYYFDTQNREAFFGRKDSTGYFEYYSNVISDIGNIVSGTYGTIKTGNLILTEQATVTGNISANYFLGNGRFLSGIDTTLITNGTSNVKVYNNSNVSISSGGVSNVAEFTAAGGNIAGDFYITGTIKALNYIGNVSGNLSAPGSNTQVIFNDNSTAGATSGFTFNKFTNSVVIAGNVNTLSNVLVNDIAVIDSNANIVTSRLQNSGVTAGTYGNASAVPVITVDDKGRVTFANTTAVAGVNNVTYDSATSNLTVFTSAGTNYSVDLNVGTSDTPVFTGLSVSANSALNALTVNNSITVGTTLGVVGNITGSSASFNGNLTTGNLLVQNFVSGNLIPSSNVLYDLGSLTNKWNDLYLAGDSIYLGDIVLTSNVNGLSISGPAIAQSFSATGNVTGAALTANGSITAGTTLQAQGGIQATPIGNVTASTGQFTDVSATGNVTGAALTANGSITAGTTLQAQGGIQATPIGNVTASTGQFTTVSATGNITGAALTANGSITAGTTLQAQGGIQATPIGNVTPSTGQFTSIDTSGNVTSDGITVNNSATVGTTLAVSGNTSVGNLRTAGTILITNTQNSVGANTGALIVQGGASFEKDVHVLGNVYTTNLIAINANTLSVTDPLLYLTATNAYPYNFDIGFYSHFVGGVGNVYQHTGFVRDVDDGVWKLFSNVAAEPTITIDFANALYDRIQTGGLTSLGSIIGNSSISIFGNAVVGNLSVNNIASISSTLVASGGIQDTPIGNVTPSTGQFTTINSSGNTTVSAITVNGSATIGGTLGVVGNIVAPYFVGNFSGNITGNITAAGTNTQIIFNDNGLLGADSGFTYNKGTDSLTVVGNINSSGITSSSSGTFASSLSAAGGIQATPIGNVTASTGQFTTVSATGNITGAALTANGSITAGTTISGLGGLQATPIGNVTPSTALFTSVGTSGNTTVAALSVNGTATIGSTLGVIGNINGSSLTLTGSEVIAGSLQSLGGLQATPIGNVTASTGQFTTVSATGNITGAALTANGSIRAITTLSAAGGLQATPIGNVMPSTAIFTSESVSGNSTVNGLTVNSSITSGTTLQAQGGIQATPIGNVTASTGQFTSLSATGNITGAALTANGSITAGTTISGLGGLQATPIGNVTPSTALFTTMSTSGNTTVAALSVNGSITAGTTLQAQGGIQNTPIGNVTPNTGQFTDVGSTGNVTGAALTANGSITAGTTLSAAGGIQATPIGSVTPSTALFTTINSSGNTTVNALTINNSSTVGGTLGVTGNIVGSNISVSGNISGSYFFGNGSQLTGIDATSIQNGTSNVKVYLNGPVTVSSAGTANVLTITDTDVTTTKTIIGTTVQAAQIGNTNSLLTGTLTTAAQPNITSVGSSLTVGEITVGSNAITSTNHTITIEPAGPGNTGNVIIEGNLRVTGNIIAIESEIVIVNDKNILLANNQTTSLGIDGAGIWAGNIAGIPIATFVYNNSTTSWQSNIGLTPAGNASLSLGGTNNYWSIGYFNVLEAPTINAGVLSGATFTATNGFNGPLNGTLGSAGGNTAIVSTLSATGNVAVAALTANGSITAITTLSAAGGIQATPIGNVTPSTALFTTLGTSGNTTVSALSVNGTATVGSTLGVTGNVTAPYFIGNVVGSITSPGADTQVLFNDSGIVNANVGLIFNKTTATLSTVTINAATIGNTNAIIIGNGASLTSLTGANVTGTVANAAYTLQAGQSNYANTATYVTGLTGTNVNVALGYVPLDSNATALTAQYVTQAAQSNITSLGVLTSLTSSGNATVAAVTVNGSATVGTTLSVTGNIIAGNLNVTNIATAAYFAGDGGRLTNVGNITVANTSVSNYYPVTFANVGTGPLNALTGGMRYNPSLGALAGLNTATIGTSITTSSLIAASLGVNLFNATATTINLGGAANVINIGATNVVATFGSGTGNIVAGNIIAVHYGNSFGTTAIYSGNATVNALTINNSATVGTTLGVTGNLVAGNITTAGSIQITAATAATSNVTGAVVVTGGVGVGGNLYVGNRVGWVASNSVSVVYQIYNNSTNSLDTIFE